MPPAPKPTVPRPRARPRPPPVSRRLLVLVVAELAGCDTGTDAACECVDDVELRAAFFDIPRADGCIGNGPRAHGMLDRQALEALHSRTVSSRCQLCLLVPRVEAAHRLLQRERSAGIWRSLNLRLELVHERDEPVRDCVLYVGLERGVRRRNMPLVLRQPRQRLLSLNPERPDLSVRPPRVRDLALEQSLDRPGEGRLERLVGPGGRERGHRAQPCETESPSQQE